MERERVFFNLQLFLFVLFFDKNIELKIARTPHVLSNLHNDLINRTSHIVDYIYNPSPMVTSVWLQRWREFIINTEIYIYRTRF